MGGGGDLATEGRSGSGDLVYERRRVVRLTGGWC
jgi:hypothetical protein